MNRCRITLFVLGVVTVLPSAKSAAQPAPVKAHSALVHCVTVSPDGKLLATAGFDNTVKIWELAPDGTLKEKKVLTGHTGPVYAVAFHPTDDKLVATASQDKTGRVWDITEGKPKSGADSIFEVSKSKFELKGHTDIVTTIAFSPDGQTLATAGVDKTVRLWNSADGKLLASGGVGKDKDHPVKVWDVKEQKELTQLRGHEQPVTGVAFVDNGTVITASMDRTIRTWTTKEPKKDTKDTKEPKKDEEPKKDTKDTKKDTEKKDAKDKKDMKDVKDMKDPKELKKLGPTTDDPYALAWSEKTKRVAVCGYSGLITIWALDADKPKFTKAIKSPGYCIAFTADGKSVITGHDNGTVVVTPIVEK